MEIWGNAFMFSVKIYHSLQVCDPLYCGKSVPAVLGGTFTTTGDDGTETFPSFHIGVKYRHDLNFLGITFFFSFLSVLILSVFYISSLIIISFPFLHLLPHEAARL